jgi:hypothetical protein
MGADIATLCEALVADFAFEGFFACVSALMGLDREWVSGNHSSKDRVVCLLSCMGFSLQMLTLRFPNWENRCPHEGSLQIYLLVSANDTFSDEGFKSPLSHPLLKNQAIERGRQIISTLTKGFSPECARL